MSRIGIVALAAVVFGGALVALGARDEGGPTLPEVVGDGPATAYRVVYEVDADGATSTEERVVVRPFDSDIVVRDSGGTITSERASRAGLLATRSSGADWVLIDVPFSPATGDTRLDRLGTAMTDELGDDEIGGRDCRELRASFPGEAVAIVDRCVDAAGIVLREVWRADDGEVVQTMTATTVEVDDVAVGPTPTGTRLAAADGNGAVRSVPDDEPVPFAESFSLDPAGWEFVGRHLVVPPALGGLPGEAVQLSATALVSDVWRRGPDLLVLDQGATKDGEPPFGDGRFLQTFSVDRVGDAALTVDERLVAANITLRDGGFVRLSGTVTPDDLRELAETIAPTGGSR